MSDLSTLIERVRGLDGPDREVDALIWGEFDFGREDRELDARWSARVPAYTASLDAVVALIEKRLPDGLWDVNGYGAAIVYPKWITGDVDTQYAETAQSPALALLLAFLVAVENERPAATTSPTPAKRCRDLTNP
jgi:hypothetical protein